MKYIELINKIFPGYPRQVGLPERRDINNIKELKVIINKFNKKKRIWLSLYKYSYTNTKNFIIDKIWFDFDDNGYENINILHRWLKDKSYKHFMVFSGKGYHCYILTDKKELKNNKVALINTHQYIINETGIVVDTQVIGDTARIVGVPGTFNCRRHRWVIFITENDLDKGEEYIFHLAEHDEIGNFKIYGSKYFSMKNFDNGIPEYETILTTPKDLDIIIKGDEILKDMKPCVANILINFKNINHSYHERFAVITHLLEDGYGEKDIEKILLKFLGLKKFNHCIKKEQQLRYLIKKPMLPPSCFMMKAKGYCPLKEDTKCKFRE